MTVAFQSPADQASWIEHHAISKIRRFKCLENFYRYYLLEDADPDMLIWFGYNESADAFFISSTVPEDIRFTVLRMECKRHYYAEDTTHLHAVQEAMTNTTGKLRQKLILALFAFYQEYADKLQQMYDPAEHLQDILATAEFLGQQP